ncbi:MAG: sulfite exporter TauE/SafE family protein [Actinomycetota bacterium]|nr:sulfite exporter TauE/SafE family protein [Actinomycetota bacterium]
MNPVEALVLVVAGVGGGLAGSVAGLASLVTYPALLAIGLHAVTANVTNTVSLVGSSVGSVSGSRPELSERRSGLGALVVAGAAGGAAGGALLLLTPPDAFERVVPWFVALSSIAVLWRRRVVEGATAKHTTNRRSTLAMVAVIGIYGGYFGAGAGVLLLAALLAATADTLPHCNAKKNLVLGVANGIAAAAFVVFGDVRWTAAVPMALGLFVGGRLGPIIVRRADPTKLRLLIAAAGLVLAVKLGVDAY